MSMWWESSHENATTLFYDFSFLTGTAWPFGGDGVLRTHANTVRRCKKQYRFFNGYRRERVFLADAEVAKPEMFPFKYGTDRREGVGWLEV